jgi:hypothetical protein
MPRWKQTGTSPGEVIGEGHITFHAREDDNAIRSCALDWNGENKLISFLPGIAFDQYFPNLREIVRGERVLRGKDAQEDVLKAFEGWVEEARAMVVAGDRLRTFGALPIAEAQPDESVSAKATVIVRMNERQERLWSETAYSSRQAEELLFGLVYQVVWDWVVGRSTKGTQERMVGALERQFGHYAINGIPSDFRMREIGRAPFVAWRALPVSADDWVQEVIDRATILCTIDLSEQAEQSIGSGPPMVLGVETWESLSDGAKSAALSLAYMGFAVRLAELEMVAEATDRDSPGWLPIAEALSTMVERYSADDSAVGTIAAADFLSKDASTTSILFESVPGLSPDVRRRIVDAWLALCDETGLSSAQAGLPDRGRLLVYGFALGAVREFALVAQEHGDAEREGRRPVV